MDMSNMVVGGAALGFLAGFWGRLKGLLHRFIGIFIVSHNLDWLTHYILYVYMRDHWKISSIAESRYNTEHKTVRPLRKMMPVTYHNIPMDSVVYRNRWNFLCLIGSNNKSTMETVNYYVKYLRWNINIEDMIVRANEHFSGLTEHQSDRFKINRFVGMSRKRMQAASVGDLRVQQNNPSQQYNQDKALRYLKWSLEEIGEFTHKDDSLEDVFQQMYLGDDARCAVDEIKHWYSSKEWYQERNITWRRGWLLHGEPGTGKTMLAKSVAQYLKIPIYVFDIASLSNQEMYEHWKEMQENTPCVAMIEDIDAVFHGRTNLIKDSELTFDCLLNCIGGVESSNGILTIITTNHLDKVDEAIASTSGGEPSRPGRIDRVIFMGKTDRAGRIAIASKILKGYNSQIEWVVDEYEDVTGAQFENVCVKLALQEFWREASN